jgi:UDP-N-acetylmuramoyl-tripeptide--D-alanyl-D-alanine ligase
MRTLKIEEIRDAVSGKIIQGDPKKEINKICIDSRKISAGDLFIGIIGERFDGHIFINDAVKKGTKAIIVDRSIKAYPGVAIILVKDTTKALQDLSHYYRLSFNNLKIIAVTGSAGKTTTKDMIASILKTQFKVLKTQGNLNNYYGLPLSLLSLNGNEDIAVLEMGMSQLGEIKLLTEISLPEIGVITNVGPTHLEYLKTVNNVAQGKRELIEGLPENGIALLNFDNKYVREMENYFQGKKLIYYGLDNDADIYAENIEIDEQKRLTTFKVHYLNDEEDILIERPGLYNVYNALPAIAIARELGVYWENIKNALRNIELSSLRFDIKEMKNDITIINDTYNANPLSMQASINAMMDIAKGRSIAVLGDMLELGSHEIQAHIDLGKFLAEVGVNILITVGRFSSLIADGAVEKGMKKTNIYIAKDNKEAGEKLLDVLSKGDTVLIKGSRSIKMEEIVDMLFGQERII